MSDPEGGEKLFHRILGGVDGDDRSGCFRCTLVAVENVHVSVSPSPGPLAQLRHRRAEGSDQALKDGKDRFFRAPLSIIEMSASVTPLSCLTPPDSTVAALVAP